MFTELIDTLRCPHAHEDSWLVASSSHTAGRHILDGRLGCPVCRATFDIVDGVVRFADAPPLAPLAPYDDDRAFRLAAQLHLVEAPQPALLVGDGARAVPSLLERLPTVKWLVADAPVALPLDERVSAIVLPADTLPIAAASLRALCVDDAHATPPLLAAAARVVRTLGRLVVPAAVIPDPSAWTLLARDEHVTVAERLPAASAPVTLRRAPANPLFSPAS